MLTDVGQYSSNTGHNALEVDNDMSNTYIDAVCNNPATSECKINNYQTYFLDEESKTVE
jgi:hypothetical protein